MAAHRPIESELKYALSHDEYRRLLAHFPRVKPQVQTNYYFDNPNGWPIRRSGGGLRIRLTEGRRATVTWKGPALKRPKGPRSLKVRTELEAEIPLATARKVIGGKRALTSLPIPPARAVAALVPLEALDGVVCLGSLANQRSTVRYQRLLLEIDKTRCFQGTTYELEVETSAPVEAARLVRGLFRILKIRYRPRETSKLAFFLRAYRARRRSLDRR